MNINRWLQRINMFLLAIMLVVALPVTVNAIEDTNISTYVTDALTEDITVNAVYTEAAPVEPEVPELPESPEWDNSENKKWAPIILGAMAGMVALFIVLRILKKKDDAAHGK